MALSLLLNGERAVVLIYVARIVSSIERSLLLEAFSLSCLSIFALFVEILADGEGNPVSKSFKTRLGVSSGILLGSIAVPGLLLSKLIQIMRVFSLNSAAIEELAYLKLQYWAASVCCLTVLVFLYIISRRQKDSIYGTQCIVGWNTTYSFICIACVVAVGLLLFWGKLYGELSVALTSLWVLLHGLAAVKLIEKILQTFPACASIGESLLVTSGLVLYIGDMFAYTASKISYLTSSTTFFVRYGFDRSEISSIIQGMVFGLLVFPMVYKYILQIFKYFTGNTRNYEIKRSLIFYASLLIMLVSLVPSWMQFVHDFPVHPLLWVFYFVLSDSLKRLTLCVYWLIVICVSVRYFYNISKNSKTERILLRKYYHLMAVSMFVPALIFQPKFLDLAFGAALAVFLLLEIIRIWKIWPLGDLVHQFMNAFTDHRDSDLLIVSHFSLLLGCALPIWLSSGFTDRPLAPFAGILSLGIGDTMASVVGHKYGVLRWSKTCKKTVEGTAAGITSVLAACFVLLPLLTATGYIFTTHWLSLIVAVTVSGLLEAYTAQLDNAFIPLIFYSLLCL